jgi:hypothetical protein
MRSRVALLLLLTTTTLSYADSGVGPEGINATGLKLPNGTVLTGTGIAIGQVEGSRPGKPTANGGPDDAANSASTIVPSQVYMGTTLATANGFRVSNHAELVASVIISTNANAKGVAPGASLNAGGYAATADLSQQRIALTMNRIATLTDPIIGEQVAAINFSEGIALDGFDTVDGSSHLTEFVDWSAAQHDVLYVSAGRESDSVGDGPVPTDNFNGITVARSNNFGSARFETVDSGNVYDDDAEGDRVSVDLIAPGVLVDVVNLGGAVTEETGTSFAAPHVVGAVALLQQYAKFQISNSVTGWVPPNARRHEVMKAILLNSADKMAFVHNSDRFIANLNGQFWEDTPAYASPEIPLDEHFGAGHLNVGNAITNFEPGEHDSGIVPLIGWDYGSIGTGAVDYTFDTPVSGWIAITLAWDRVVELNDPDNTYSFGDEFFTDTIENQLTDLNLYLLDSDDNIIHSSIAEADSVEHIFWEVEAEEDYKIRVVHVSGDAQDYGLAWWAGEATVGGDFNGSGAVNGRDFLEWQRNPSVGNLGDWQANYGMGSLTASNTAVPEPSSLVMLSILTAASFVRRSA